MLLYLLNFQCCEKGNIVKVGEMAKYRLIFLSPEAPCKWSVASSINHLINFRAVGLIMGLLRSFQNSSDHFWAPFIALNLEPFVTIGPLKILGGPWGQLGMLDNLWWYFAYLRNLRVLGGGVDEFPANFFYFC